MREKWPDRSAWNGGAGATPVPDQCGGEKGGMGHMGVVALVLSDTVTPQTSLTIPEEELLIAVGCKPHSGR